GEGEWHSHHQDPRKHRLEDRELSSDREDAMRGSRRAKPPDKTAAGVRAVPPTDAVRGDRRQGASGEGEPCGGPADTPSRGGCQGGQRQGASGAGEPCGGPADAPARGDCQERRQRQGDPRELRGRR
ncbi:MAG: hypothetical protein ACK559_29530, partial [bacterium]